MNESIEKAKEIIINAIKNTQLAENVYPNIKENLIKRVLEYDDFSRETMRYDMPRDLKTLEKQLAELEQQRIDNDLEYYDTKLRRYRTYEACEKSNNITRRIHNTQININQEKMKR